MVHNKNITKYNNRRQQNRQTTYLNSLPQHDLSMLELKPENYTAYVFLLLFDAYYQPWLKDCNADKFVTDFKSRVEQLVQSLESAFPQFPRFKNRIMSLAQRNCFNIRRKLKITIENVHTVSGNISKHKIRNKYLQVRIFTKNIENMELACYNSNFLIKLHPLFSMFIDFPVNIY